MDNELEKIQYYILNIYMISLFLALFFYFPNLETLENYLLYAATFLLSAHMWYGALFLLKKLGPTEKFSEYLIDIVILVFRFLTIYAILIMPIWLVVNGVAMLFGGIKYKIATKRNYKEGIKKYARNKSSFEIVVTLSSVLLAIFVWVFDKDVIRQSIAILLVIGQLLGMYWIIFIKKIYRTK